MSVVLCCVVLVSVYTDVMIVCKARYYCGTVIVFMCYHIVYCCVVELMAVLKVTEYFSDVLCWRVIILYM